MALWEPVDVDPIGGDEIGEEDDKWDDDLMNDLEKRFEELRRFNKTFEGSRDKDTGGIVSFYRCHQGMILKNWSQIKYMIH